MGDAADDARDMADDLDIEHYLHMEGECVEFCYFCDLEAYHFEIICTNKYWGI